MHRRLGDSVGAAYAAFMLANALAEQKQVERARELYQQSISVFRATGADAWALLATARHLAYLYEDIGDHAHARNLHERNLRRAREIGNDRFAATSLSGLAGSALTDADQRSARTARREPRAAPRPTGPTRHGRRPLALDASVCLRRGARGRDMPRGSARSRRWRHRRSPKQRLGTHRTSTRGSTRTALAGELLRGIRARTGAHTSRGGRIRARRGAPAAPLTSAPPDEPAPSPLKLRIDLGPAPVGFCANAHRFLSRARAHARDRGSPTAPHPPPDRHRGGA